MKKLIALTLLGYSGLVSSQEPPQGLTVGVGAMASTQTKTPEETFLEISQNDQQIRLLPNIQYTYGAFTYKFTGVSWRNHKDNRYRVMADVGWSSSKIKITDKNFKMPVSLEFGLEYKEGVLPRVGVELGPLSLSYLQGVNDYQDYQASQLGLGAPVYMNRPQGVTVIGKLGYRNQSTEYTQINFDIPESFIDDDLEFWDASLVTMFRLNERSRLMLNGTLTQFDPNLVDQTDLPETGFRVFAMYSVHLGAMHNN